MRKRTIFTIALTLGLVASLGSASSVWAAEARTLTTADLADDTARLLDDPDLADDLGRAAAKWFWPAWLRLLDAVEAHTARTNPEFIVPEGMF